MEMNNIYNLDCREGLKQLKDSSIDLVITSPPYNTKKEYDEWNDNLPEQEYEKFIKDVVALLYTKLKDDGRVCWNVADILGGLEKRNVSRCAQAIRIFEQCGFKFYTQVIWYQKDFGCVGHPVGSFKSASCPFLTNQYEYIIIFYKKERRKLNKGTSDISSEEYLKWTRDSLWAIGPCRPIKESSCLVPFPVELVTRLLKLFSYKNDVILDPFAGAGTTLLVSRKLERRYIGFELSKTYYKQIKSRLAQQILWI